MTANETIILPKSEIDERRSSEQSMMAEDLWKPLSEHEIRSLVTYLASPAQVPLPARERAPESEVIADAQPKVRIVAAGATLGVE